MAKELKIFSSNLRLLRIKQIPIRLGVLIRRGSERVVLIKPGFIHTLKTAFDNTTITKFCFSFQQVPTLLSI